MKFHPQLLVFPLLLCSCEALEDGVSGLQSGFSGLFNSEPNAEVSVNDVDDMLEPGARMVVFVDQSAATPSGVDVDVAKRVYTDVTTQLISAGYDVVDREQANQVLTEVERQRLSTNDPEASQKMVDGLQTDVGFFIDINGWTSEQKQSTDAKGRKTKRNEVHFFASLKILDFRNLRTIGSGKVEDDVRDAGADDVVKVAERSIKALTREAASKMNDVAAVEAGSPTGASE